MKNYILSFWIFSVTLVLLSSCSDSSTGPTSGVNEDSLQAVNKTAISGKVLDASTGRPISLAVLTTNPSTSSVLSDSLTGSFFLRGTGVGEFTITAQKVGYTNVSTKVKTRIGDTIVANLVMNPIPTNAGRIRGVVRNASTGAVIAQANITTKPSTYSVVTDSKGEFRIDNINPIEYKITAEKGGFSSLERSVVVGANKESIADFNLSPVAPTVGVLTGKVTDNQNDTGVAEVNITTEPATASVKTNANGIYTIPNIPAKVYKVIAVRTGFARQEKTITVTNGQTTIADFQLLLQTGSLVGEIRSGVDGKPLDNANITTNPPTVSLTTDASGTYSIPSVPSGKYTVRVTRAGFKAAAVDVTIIGGAITTANVVLVP